MSSQQCLTGGGSTGGRRRRIRSDILARRFSPKGWAIEFFNSYGCYHQLQPILLESWLRNRFQGKVIALAVG